jgi:glycosyltransferase involved in cell wall biosynthesis
MAFSQADYGVAMRVLMVTPMLPYPQAVNAGSLVMHAQLAALADRHDVTLATLAGPDPAEWEGLNYLRAAGIDVKTVWRPKPSDIVRRWEWLASLAGPDPAEWEALDHLQAAGIDIQGVWHPNASSIRRWKRRLRLASYWLCGRYPLRTLQFWEPEMQRLLDCLLAETPFDLVQVEDNAMGSYSYRTQTPIVLTEHEVRLPSPSDPYGRWKASRVQRVLNKAERRRWRRYQPAVWRRFDRIQVFTPRDAGAIQTMAPELASRVRVNPFGVELLVKADPSREEKDTAVFVGGFCHQPNVEAALWLGNDIMPLLRKLRPGIRLIIVGSYPTKAVQALASDDIVVTGRVPAVEPFLERAAVVLVPMRTGGGMRLKVLQAMAMGKAIVTTPLGAEGLAVPGCQPPLVIAEDAYGIASATAALLSADEDRRALGRRACAFVTEHHSWPAYRERLEAIYAELRPIGSMEGRREMVV